MSMIDTTEVSVEQQYAAGPKIRINFPDILLIVFALMISCIGLIMVASASSPKGVSSGHGTLFYAYRQLIYYFLGLISCLAAFSIPTDKITNNGKKIYFAGLVLLLMVFIPFLGVEINGAKRWLSLGIVNFQSGEAAKLCMIIFTAHYLRQHCAYLRIPEKNHGIPDRNFLKYCGLLALSALVYGVVLMKQPDFGTTVVIFTTVFAMLFVFGIPTRILLLPVVICLIVGVYLIKTSEYRLQRVTSFMAPCSDPYGDGYQLCNSIIAIGRGNLTGTGLGESVFKHSYIPEEYTDFIFAIIAEEFGFIGSVGLILLYSLFVWRIFTVGARASRNRMVTASYIAYGCGIWFAMQALINIAVVSGVAPTKGLTMPLISYGGSSILITGIAIGIILRIDARARFLSHGRHLMNENIPIRARYQ